MIGVKLKLTSSVEQACHGIRFDSVAHSVSFGWPYNQGAAIDLDLREIIRLTVLLADYLVSQGIELNKPRFDLKCKDKRKEN